MKTLLLLFLLASPVYASDIAAWIQDAGEKQVLTYTECPRCGKLVPELITRGEGYPMVCEQCFKERGGK